MLLNIPHFIVLGGHKCGTTSLHKYLNQHPDICMPIVKGADFFSRFGNSQLFTSLNDYIALYDRQEVAVSKIAGEVSSVYLYSKKARNLIKQYLHDAKLIIILRNPTDRSLSHFLQTPEFLANGSSESLQEILFNQKILELGYYYKFVKKYFAEFPKNNTKVFLFESLIKNSEFRSLFEFIGVDPNFQPDTSIIMRKGGNVTKRELDFLNFLKFLISPVIKPLTTPKQRHYMVSRAKTMLTKQQITIPEEIKLQLTQLYREDILRTQELTKLDLSSWLSDSKY